MLLSNGKLLYNTKNVSWSILHIVNGCCDFRSHDSDSASIVFCPTARGVFHKLIAAAMVWLSPASLFNSFVDWLSVVSCLHSHSVLVNWWVWKTRVVHVEFQSGSCNNGFYRRGHWDPNSSCFHDRFLRLATIALSHQLFGKVQYFLNSKGLCQMIIVGIFCQVLFEALDSMHVLRIVAWSHNTELL